MLGYLFGLISTFFDVPHLVVKIFRAFVKNVAETGARV